MDKNNIDIKKLYEIIETNKKFILRVTSLFFIVSIFYSFTKTEYYKSSISLYAAGELDDSSIFSQYGHLAENIGISSVPSSNYYIPDIINSRSLKKEIVLKKWNNYKFSKPTNLIDYLEINDVSFLSNSFEYWSCINDPLWLRSSDDVDKILWVILLPIVTNGTDDII